MSENCLALVLAAGSSSRFGSSDKRLGLFLQQPLIYHCLCQLHESQLPIAVALVEGDTIAAQLRSDFPDILVLELPANKVTQGMGSTIAAAISLLQRQGHLLSQQPLMICLADMPLIKASTFRQVADAIRLSLCDAVVPKQPQQNRWGHPIAIKGEFIRRFAMLSGDRGGKSCLQQSLTGLEFLTVDDAGIYCDVDTPAALAALNDKFR